MLCAAAVAAALLLLRQIPGARHRPADLKQVPPGAWQILDALPPQSGYSALDPAAALPWAVDLARRWAPDARLDFLDAVRVRPDGTVDVQRDPEAAVQYRFVSPSLVAEYRKQAERGKATQVDTLFLRARHGHVEGLVSALPSRSPEEGAAIHDPQARSLADVMTTLASQGRLAARPFYLVEMYPGYDTAWWWDLKNLPGDETLAHVAAGPVHP